MALQGCKHGVHTVDRVARLSEVDVVIVPRIGTAFIVVGP